MPYTTHGYMTQADMDDYRRETDTGSTGIYLDNPPDWFDAPEHCPVCGDPMDAGSYEAVRVADASGEIHACLPLDGEWQYLPSEPTF
jgi:hypothetical protein